MAGNPIIIGRKTFMRKVLPSARSRALKRSNEFDEIYFRIEKGHVNWILMVLRISIANWGR